jgi:hypothetical protein
MLRMRTLVAVIVAVAGVGAGAAWAAGNNGSTTPSKQAPSKTAPRQQHPMHHCPNMGSSGSGASYMPSTGATNL